MIVWLLFFWNKWKKFVRQDTLKVLKRQFFICPTEKQTNKQFRTENRNNQTKHLSSIFSTCTIHKVWRLDAASDITARVPGWAWKPGSVGRTHSCLQCAGKSIGHTADIMQEFNLAWEPVRWVINPVKVLLPSTPLFRGWMGLWMGCSDLPGFSFRTPRLSAKHWSSCSSRWLWEESGSSQLKVGVLRDKSGAQWVAGWALKELRDVGFDPRYNQQGL